MTHGYQPSAGCLRAVLRNPDWGKLAADLWMEIGSDTEGCLLS